MKEDYQKTFKKLTWVFLLHLVPFYRQDYKKGVQVPLGWQNIIRKNPFLVIYHQGSFDDLTLSSFWVIPKITIANLCNLVHNVIIISVLSDPMNLETVESKEEITKNWSARESKELSKWNKDHFS